MSSSSSSSSHFYLVKSEPNDYSIQQLQVDGQEEWDGVRNYAARNHLQAMKVGDRCLFYHSACQVPAIVGSCTIVRTAQPDPTFVAKDDADKGKSGKNPWVSVRVEFEALFETPVTLKELRAQAAAGNAVVAGMTLLKQSRLSVMQLTQDEWQAVLDLQRQKDQGHDLLQLGQLVETAMAAAASPGGCKKRARDEDNKKAQVAGNEKSPKYSSTNENKANLVDVPGYCSDPSRALTISQLQFVLNDEAAVVTEKELGLKGRKHMNKLLDVGGVTSWVHYYDGTKFVSKDKARLDAMVGAVRSGYNGGDAKENITVYLLLSTTSGICRRNTLPALLQDGVIVQRVGLQKHIP